MKDTRYVGRVSQIETKRGVYPTGTNTVVFQCPCGENFAVDMLHTRKDCQAYHTCGYCGRKDKIADLQKLAK